VENAFRAFLCPLEPTGAKSRCQKGIRKPNWVKILTYPQESTSQLNITYLIRSEGGAMVGS
jgi:hypothetical protein